MRFTCLSEVQIVPLHLNWSLYPRLFLVFEADSRAFECPNYRSASSCGNPLLIADPFSENNIQSRFINKLIIRIINEYNEVTNHVRQIVTRGSVHNFISNLLNISSKNRFMKRLENFHLTCLLGSGHIKSFASDGWRTGKIVIRLGLFH